MVFFGFLISMYSLGFSFYFILAIILMYLGGFGTLVLLDKEIGVDFDFTGDAEGTWLRHFNLALVEYGGFGIV